jgi:hypothetical protein
MRTLWVVCCLFAFGLFSLTGCNPDTAADSSKASATTGTDKAKDKKKNGKAAPGKNAKPHTTSAK